MIAQDWLILLVPWVVGAALGGRLGYGVALVARRLIAPFPGVRSGLPYCPGGPSS